MEVGLLVCDHVPEALRPISGEYIDMFRHLLPELDIRPYFVCDNEFPASADDHAGYLTTGSSYSVYDDEPWIRRLASFVRDVHRNKIQFFGVCFGHQMIAHALGGAVKKAPAGWCLGTHAFDVTSHQHWMQPRQERFNVLMLCQDQVIELPAGSEVVARSEQCPVGMYTVGKHTVGIQGHPEYSKEYDRALFSSRSDRIPADKIAEGHERLLADPDTADLARWIVRFFTGL
jgi:GMP synthase-like glutamine amidotransferase